MNKKIYILIIGIFLLSGCINLKTIRLLKQGEVTSQNFVENIAFQEKAGLIIVEVIIDGEEYHFILDTGAPMVISERLAEKLGLVRISTSKVSDSQLQKQKLSFVKIDTITLGNLEYTNIGALIVDIQNSEIYKCFDIDGFIGANLMNKAIWQFNFSENKITITDNTNELPHSEDKFKTEFNTNAQGSPYINAISERTKIKKILIDFGSNGNINMSNKTFKKIIGKNEIKTVKGFGSSQLGIYGRVVDSMFIAKLPNFQIDKLNIDNVIVISKESTGNTIGTDFFRNYITTIDWINNKISFKPISSDQNGSFLNFGFTYKLDDNKLSISSIINNSPADKANLEIGNQIIELDGINYESITENEYCQLFLSQILKKKDEINLVIRDGNITRKIELKKTELIK
jgi:predicted aspartyl protease